MAAGPCWDCDDPHKPRYADTDPIWARFNVAPPDFRDLTKPTMPASGAGMGCLDSDGNRICGDYWTQMDAYNTEVDRRRMVQLAELQTGLDTFNADLASRRFEDYYVTTLTGQEVTKDVVIASKPGQIVAGGSVNFNGGGVNTDSIVIANGQFISDGALTNQATRGQVTTVDTGHVYLSHLDSCRAGFSECRRNDPVLPIPSIANSSEFNLDVRPLTPPGHHTAPGNQTAGAGATRKTTPWLAWSVACARNHCQSLLPAPPPATAPQAMPARVARWQTTLKLARP